MKYEKEHKQSRDWFTAAIAGIFLLAVLIAMSGCHTVSGFGQDLRSWASPAVTNSNRAIE